MLNSKATYPAEPTSTQASWMIRRIESAVVTQITNIKRPLKVSDDIGQATS